MASSRPFPSFHVWQLLQGIDPSQVQWLTILQHSGNILGLAGLSALSLVLSTVKLEVATERDIQWQRELMVMGLANGLSGLTFGLPGTVSLKSSLRAWRLGGRHRLVGLSAAAIFALVLLY